MLRKTSMGWADSDPAPHGPQGTSSRRTGSSHASDGLSLPPAVAAVPHQLHSPCGREQDRAGGSVHPWAYGSCLPRPACVGPLCHTGSRPYALPSSRRRRAGRRVRRSALCPGSMPPAARAAAARRRDAGWRKLPLTARRRPRRAAPVGPELAQPELVFRNMQLRISRVRAGPWLQPKVASPSRSGDAVRGPIRIERTRQWTRPGQHWPGPIHIGPRHWPDPVHTGLPSSPGMPQPASHGTRSEATVATVKG
jgi:hypothetical protein